MKVSAWYGSLHASAYLSLYIGVHWVHTSLCTALWVQKHPAHGAAGTACTERTFQLARTEEIRYKRCFGCAVFC